MTTFDEFMMEEGRHLWSAQVIALEKIADVLTKNNSQQVKGDCAAGGHLVQLDDVRVHATEDKAFFSAFCVICGKKQTKEVKVYEI